LKVFGCSAYVYLPNAIQKNFLSPKSELMVFIGITEGIKGYKFMRQANNSEFTATTALFDKTMFPKCLKAEQRVYTRINENYAQDNPEKDKIQQIPSEDDNLLYPPSKNDKKDKENHCDNDKDDTNTPGAYEEPPAPCQPTPNLDKGQEHQNVPSPTEYREHPHRVRSHVTHPGNVYRETRSPIDIEKEICQIKGWKHMIRDTSRAISESKRSISRPSSEVSNDNSNQEESIIMKLAHEGGVCKGTSRVTLSHH